MRSRPLRDLLRPARRSLAADAAAFVLTAFLAWPVQAAPNCCPAMPVVATSKEPAKGKVAYELTPLDLDNIFSNRHLMFANGWDDAVVALAHDIDPTGEYGIWDRPRPPITTQVALAEGDLSGRLVKPPPPGSPSGFNAQLATMRLLYTLARINKYGETSEHLRDAALTLARFLIVDLNRVPPEIQRRDPNALRIKAEGANALGAVLGAIANGRNPRLQFQYKVKPDDLPLDALDMANAAMDVMWAIDDKNQTLPLVLPGNAFDNNYGYTLLIALASVRPQFGGTAAPNSAQDAVGCRAFSIVASTADISMAGSKPRRQSLLGRYAAEATAIGAPAAKPAELDVLRTALILAGFDSAEEARSVPKALIPAAIAGARNDAARDEFVSTLRALTQSAGGPGRDTYRSELADQLSAEIDGMEKRNAFGKYQGGTNVGTGEEFHFLQRWEAWVKTEQPLAAVNQPCAPDPGRARPRIFLFAILSDGLQLINHAYVGVPMIIEAQFDPPSGEIQVTIDASFGTQAAKVIVKRIDPKGYIFRSDPLMPEGASPQDPVFDPAPPPRTQDR
jgi:hypothetical protein